MKAAFAAVVILLSMLIWPHPSLGQSAPDAVFYIGYFNPGTGQPTAWQVPATSWSHTRTITSGSSTATSTVNGSASSNSLNATIQSQIQASGTDDLSIGSKHRVMVYVRGRSSASVTTTNSGEVSITSGSTSPQYAGYSPEYWGSGVISATTNATGSASSARTDSTTRHYDPACGTSGTSFPEYPGVVYYLTDGEYGPTNRTPLSTNGGGTGSTLTASGTMTVSVTLGAAVPNVTINNGSIGF